MFDNGYEIITLADRKKWLHYLSVLPSDAQDIYMMPNYYELYENENSKAECFVFHENGQFVLYPYLKNNINQIVGFELGSKYYDIEGAYGYNGVIASGVTQTMIDNFGDTFRNYCKKENVIAEFVRLNPLISNHLHKLYFDIELVNKIVIVDLNLEPGELWYKSYEHAARKNINKAHKNDVNIAIFYGNNIDDNWIDKFIEIYHKTLDRKDARSFYYFGGNFLRNLCKKLPNNSLLAFALKDSIAVSCELVLFQGRTAYSFIGGTLPEYFPLRPNNLLKHEIILRLMEMGLTQYCLGGGVETGDTIYKYKKTFSKNNSLDFYIGKYVHDQMAYEEICALWAERYPEKLEKYLKYFMKYKH